QINNAGTIVHSVGDTYMGNGTITNLAGGLIDLQGRSLFFDFGASAIINNSGGTIRKTTSSGVTISVPFNNAGTLDVQAGNLNLATLTQSAGHTRVNGGATLNLSVAT